MFGEMRKSKTKYKQKLASGELKLRIYNSLLLTLQSPSCDVVSYKV